MSERQKTSAETSKNTIEAKLEILQSLEQLTSSLACEEKSEIKGDI